MLRLSFQVGNERGKVGELSSSSPNIPKGCAVKASVTCVEQQASRLGQRQVSIFEERMKHRGSLVGMLRPGSLVLRDDRRLISAKLGKCVLTSHGSGRKD